MARSIINRMCRSLLATIVFRVAATIYAVPWGDVSWWPGGAVFVAAHLLEMYFWGYLNIIYLEKWYLEWCNPHCFTTNCNGSVTQLQRITGSKVTLAMCARCSRAPLTMCDPDKIVPCPSGPPMRIVAMATPPDKGEVNQSVTRSSAR